MSLIAPSLQAYFTDRLIRERRVSPHTIRSYRDTIRLLVAFAAQRAGTAASALTFTDLDAKTISAFLDHLEQQRGCTPRTRNARLAAVRSFYRYAALEHPEHAATIERVLAIPLKRTDRPLVTWLTKPELEALLAAPDRRTWTGRRDHAMILLAAQTGLRASELTNVRIGDVTLGVGAHVRTLGKGRRERVTPLIDTTVATLRVWLKERGGMHEDPLFPTRTGRILTRDAVARRLTKHAARAAESCPSLRSKTVTPHTLRHYVDGWVMWPAAMFSLAGPGAEPGSGHIIRGAVLVGDRWSMESDQVRAVLLDAGFVARSRVGRRLWARLVRRRIASLFITIGEADSHAGNRDPRRVWAGDRRVDYGRAVEGDDQTPRGGVQRFRRVLGGPRPGAPNRGGLPRFHRRAVRVKARGPARSDQLQACSARTPAVDPVAGSAGWTRPGGGAGDNATGGALSGAVPVGQGRVAGGVPAAG
jgi:integrase/recombinase XerD